MRTRPSVCWPYGPRESSPRFEAASPPVSATVKWYNPEKGFGFAQLPTGGDAFLHVSVVERSGNSTVPPGATLEVRIGSGQKGQQVTEILSVDASTAAQEPARRPRPERPQAPPNQAAVEEFGTVKFYAPERGFGFIVRDRGGKDIFVHTSALKRAGISELAEGQRVAVDMVEGGKGPEAVSIRLIGDGVAAVDAFAAGGLLPQARRARAGAGGRCVDARAQRAPPRGGPSVRRARGQG